MAGGTSALAFCWRIERRDGAGIALTSHDEGMVRHGTAYRPNPGVMPSAITRSLGLEPHSGEIAGAIAADALTDEDLALGRWDGARVSLTAATWDDPNAEPVRLIGGELGEVASDGEGFTAELRGAADKLLEPVCPSTSPECRARFGDKACRVDLSGRNVRATVIAVDGQWLETDVQFDDRFLFGRLRYLSGKNCGATTVVLAVDGARALVRDVAKADVAIGTQMELREGCDKRFETCADRFQNAANFRGEPHLPGNDLLTRDPGA